MNVAIHDRMPSSQVTEPRVRHWRIALALGAANGLAAMLLIPYLLASTGTSIGKLGLPPAAAVAISGVQSALLGFTLAWAGLRLGSTIGLDAPLLRAWTSPRELGRAAPRPAWPRRSWLVAAAIGVASGGLIVALDAALFAGALASAASAKVQAGASVLPHATRWQGLLASFYGGIGEEVQIRLFLMTLIAWCLAKVTRSKTPPVFIAAIALAALAFGAGHLPMAAQMFGTLTAPLIVRTLLLNGIAGLAFGALYWRWGLEHAIVAHFCADIVLHVIVGA